MKIWLIHLVCEYSLLSVSCYIDFKNHFGVKVWISQRRVWKWVWIVDARARKRYQKIRHFGPSEIESGFRDPTLTSQSLPFGRQEGITKPHQAWPRPYNPVYGRLARQLSGLTPKLYWVNLPRNNRWQTAIRSTLCAWNVWRLTGQSKFKRYVLFVCAFSFIFSNHQSVL